MAILWLASFPKSGNTWLRAFLANYLANQSEPIPLETLRRFGYSDAHVWPYESIAGKLKADLNEAEVLRLRPQVHQYFANSRPEHVLVKTHFAMANAGGVDTITRKVTHGAICVVRNPWDVAMSYADHYGTSIADAVTALAQPSLTVRANDTNIRQYLGSWSDHVSSWHSVAWLKRLTIRYEDMTSKPTEAFAQVVRFMGLPLDRERLGRAITFSSFRMLQEQEVRDGFAEKSQHAERFFRSGQAGGWRREMPPDLAHKIARDHAQVLRALEYAGAEG